ncbi:MAG: hypothetical protein A3E87_02405 [Gammaproteobacteria bacterium RIFCSPHIGHO2_12_FULL_35_23]|nr:MAG: hypothetical protein A3E87_02405 [Gammaproteobacteria bacterium RIFCSPHIGHO2_12_FULL_35_23]
MRNLFTDHPHSVGETYFQHLYFAVVFSRKLIVAGIACAIHAIFPFVFKTIASKTVAEISVQLSQTARQKDFEQALDDCAAKSQIETEKL